MTGRGSCRNLFPRIQKPKALRVAPGAVVLSERQFDQAIKFPDKARFPRSRGSWGLSGRRKIVTAVALFLPPDPWSASDHYGCGGERG